MQVLGKFYNSDEAKEFLSKATHNEPSAQIVSRKVQLKLKALNIGLFHNRLLAEAAVKVLKNNGILAFAHEMQSGKYRVHAGALHDEKNYQTRYKKLVALGYKQIETSFTEIETTEYLIVKYEKESSTIQNRKNFKSKLIKLQERTTITATRFNADFTYWSSKGKIGSANYFNSAINLIFDLDRRWKIIYGARFFINEQSSSRNVQKSKFLLEPTYLHYHTSNSNWRFGAIDTIWDEETPDSLSNLITRKNTERYKLDSAPNDRRLPSWGLRGQYSRKQYLLDFILIPFFQAAQLPNQNNIWHPLNSANGTIRQIDTTEDLAYLLKNGDFAQSKRLSGETGFRITKKVGANTRSVTLQYFRRSEPYYRLSQTLQTALKSGQTATEALANTNEKSFTLKHPYSLAFTLEERGKISLFEVSLLSNKPYTTNKYEMKTATAAVWKFGFDYPHMRKSSKLNIYLEGERLNTQENILDQKTRLAIAGQLARKTKNRYWDLSIAFNISINHYDLFLNPRITFNHSKQTLIYLNYQIFAGSDGTKFGFYRSNSNASLAWSSQL